MYLAYAQFVTGVHISYKSWAWFKLQMCAWSSHLVSLQDLLLQATWLLALVHNQSKKQTTCSALAHLTLHTMHVRWRHNQPHDA